MTDPGPSAASADRGTGKVVVLGGSGFVGRRLAWDLAACVVDPPVYVVHRTRPGWLDVAPVEVRMHSLDDTGSLRRVLDDCSVLVNLLRPDGTGWYAGLLRGLLPEIAATGIRRYIHVSSIDVYGNAPGVLLDEETRPFPGSPYAQEHLTAERLALEAMPQTLVLRLGAVFGPGGRNVTSFAKEAASAPRWLLAARRMLYARRRMHLVSVETVCAVIAQLVGGLSRSMPAIMLVTDDDDERNNFAFMQDVLMTAFGRADLNGLPMLPVPALEAVLRLRSKPVELVRRRFSFERMQTLGLERPDFGNCLSTYARLLAAERGDVL